VASNQWKLKLFGDLCSSVDGVQIGPFGSQLHASDYVESGIPVVMPKDMINTEISTDSIAYVSEEIANRLSKHRLKAGDLVFARRGDIGRFVIVSSEQTGWLCGTGCIRARFKPNIYPEFISLILQSHSVQYCCWANNA
jgi:type I restriction enzyme, S subunit